MDKKNTSLSDAVALFQVYNRSENKSQATIEWYDLGLGILASTARGLGPDVPMAAITEERLRHYVVALSERRADGSILRPASLNAYVRAARAFFKWAYLEGFTETHLLARLRPPKIPYELVEILSEDETERLLKTTSANSRDHAIMSLFLDSGLRASELSGLRLGDVSIESCTVKVMGKGRKERIVPFGNTTRKVLLDYVSRHRPADTPTDHLFFSNRGRPVNRDTIKQLMERLGRRAGIKRLHAHLLRHSYATSFLLAGGSSLLLKQNLGHTTMAMVDRYVHLASQRAAAVSREFSPIDVLRASRAGRRRPGQPRDGINGHPTPG